MFTSPDHPNDNSHRFSTEHSMGSNSTLPASEPEELLLNDLEINPKRRAQKTSAQDEADAAGSGPSPPVLAAAEEYRPARRRSSGVSFEKHDSVIFEELSNLLSDSEDDESESEEEDNEERQGSRHTDKKQKSSGNADLIGNVIPGSSTGRRRSSKVSNSSIPSLPSVYEDTDSDKDEDEDGKKIQRHDHSDSHVQLKSDNNNKRKKNKNHDSFDEICVVTRFEQDILTRAMQQRNPMVKNLARSRSESVLQATSGGKSQLDTSSRIRRDRGSTGRLSSRSGEHRQIGNDTQTFDRSHIPQVTKNDSFRNTAAAPNKSATGVGKSVARAGRSFLDSFNRKK